ncbi:hypothetical protein [Flavobacterium haoranii]|uniref:Lipocalin-like domain-containing protein n=1 Tax=Flavobacterium haoranii TaxID=683124 RepID=A0A1M6EKK4_9FLAO|nr:hypothetical protein [Flavobacterium haoranii]SHI85926.1 hypothetical protein SAMN05444337_0966 [Flavobacterium haoranii]
MKTVKLILSVLFISSVTLFTSCSSDDDGGSGLSGVPTGEIVEVSLRQETLTGFDDEGNGSQKWWTHVVSSADFSSDDCGDDQTVEDGGYYAWYPNGNYYYKTSINGSTTLAGSWEWTNSSKTKIYIHNNSTGAEGEMTLTYLNESNIVYGIKQSGGGCSVTTYEQFNNPF